MEDFAFSYWWLIFPVMWMVSGAWGMWLHHRRQQATLEVMKTYAAQGRDPSELAKTLDAAPGAAFDGRWRRRAWRYTPFWAWRRAIVTAAVAAGFWWAAYYGATPFAWHFEIVAVIMSIVAAASLLGAIASSLFAPRLPQA